MVLFGLLENIFPSTEFSQPLSRKLMARPIRTLSGARNPVLELVYPSFLMEEVTQLHSSFHYIIGDLSKCS